MTQEEFIKFLDLSKEHSSELIRWSDDKAIGISLIKEYPAESKFIPIKDPSGTNDSVSLIKIGYITSEVKDDKVKLLVSASKASRYLFKHHFYNFEDQNCPKKELVIASERSKQPADLDEYGRFIFSTNIGELIDTNDNKKITGNNLVDYIWALHLKSITYLPFRSKLKIKKIGYVIADYITPNKFPHRVSPFLKKLLNSAGWDFNIDKGEILLGYTRMYSFKKHLRKMESEKIKPFGIPLDKTPTFICMLLLFALLIMKTFYYKDVFGIVDFVNQQVSNPIFQIAFMIVIVYSVDFLIPRLILYIINLSIFVRKLSMKPTKIS